MPIDPWLLSRFPLLDGVPSYEAMFTDPALAAKFGAFQQDPAPYSPPVVSITDTVAPGPLGDIPLRIYRSDDADDAARAGLLWMHGGAFLGGDLEMPESHLVSIELAHRTGAVVVAVDYRLVGATGLKYPAPLDDVVAAWQWFVSQSSALGVDRARISIGGASAGGNLAASASMRLRDTIAVGGSATLPHSMLLAYPIVHFPVPSLEPGVIDEMKVLPGMMQFAVAFHEQNLMVHLGRITNVPAGIAPGNFALEGMPPAFIAPCEYDELRPSAELFARQLASVGVPVEVQLAEGMVHGHLNRTPALAGVERTVQFFADALGR